MKILVKIKDNQIYFLNRKRLGTGQKNMLNTNVISNDELVFSDEYISKNYKIIASFFNELTENYEINTLNFQNVEVALLIAPVINRMYLITSINIESEEVLPYKLCEIYSKCGNLKYLSVKYIPQYMFEMLDKVGIRPESRDETLFTSNFMALNNLSNYSSIYYKYSIYLDFPLSLEDTDDFITFCKINKNLKIIHINTPDKIGLEEIVFYLKDYKHKNVKILIHSDTVSSDVLSYLKKNSKHIKKKYKISFKFSYSKEYIEDNIIKEANNTILRTCAIIMLMLAITSSAAVFFDNYRSMKKVAKIQKEIETYIIASDPDEIIDKMENEDENSIKNKYIASLTEINPDAVGWLKVNNTNIDYPILQSYDNNYYLEYNIYKEKDPNGWLFLDYENNVNTIDDNTIIFGHNRYVNGVMFGTLNKTLYEEWYTNPENQIIEFDTMYGSYKYKIFSIYIVPTTTDYIHTSFLTLEEKLDFLDTITKRSIYNFGLNVNENTKVLTLSTCQSDTTRLVVHAALID